jgi:hypothetical protein
MSPKAQVDVEDKYSDCPIAKVTVSSEENIVYAPKKQREDGLEP